jgi:4-hydroxy-3-methylbut-2-enyl diphosphate reductase
VSGDGGDSAGTPGAGAGAGVGAGTTGVGELLLAAPLRIEAALIASAVRARGGRRAHAVHKTGMGPAKARAAAVPLAREPARAVLVVGFCGGLDEESVPGEVIIPEHVFAASDEGHVQDRVACALAPDLISRLAGRGMKLRSGPIVCVSRIATGERREQLLRAGAIGVDMESVWLGAAAGERPFGVVRVVLDSPSHELFRLGAVGGALRAARSLRRVAGALHEWVPAG